MPKVAQHRRKAVVSLIALVGIALAGCSSSGDSPSQGTSATGGNSTNSGASGEPIKVLNFAPLDNPAVVNPETVATAQAWVQQTNATGGVNGHPIQLETCNTSFDPNKELACFKKAVTEKVAAVVGSNEFFGAGMALLDKAGIPWIGGLGQSPQEYTLPIAFNPTGGPYTWFLGAAAQLNKLGSKKPVMITCEIPACTLDAKLFQTGFDYVGIKTRTVVAPLTRADLGSQVAQAISGGTDGIALAVTSTNGAKLVTGLRQSGYKGPIIITSPSIIGNWIKQVGANAEGIYVGGLTTPVSDTTNEEVAKMAAALDKYAPSTDKDPLALVTWNAFDLFAKAATQVSGSVDAASLLSVLSNISTPIQLGLSGPYQTKGVTSPYPDWPRLYGYSFFPIVIKGGEMVTDGAFFDPLKSLKG